MEWTDRQKEVIEKKNTDILVAAAAGSGKTAVLVEKIKRLIIDDGVGIDKFLIVTFTRAAASEMKEKIADALMEHAQRDKAATAYLHEQLEKLSNASISTFDAFAIDIVRNYFYIIDIDPDLEICAPEESAILSSEAMDETFELLYESCEEDVLDFLDAYSSPKSDKVLKDTLISIYSEIMSMPMGLEWLKKAENVLSFTEKDFMESELADEIVLQCRESGRRGARILQKACDLLNDYGLDRLAEKIESDIKQVEKAYECTKSDAREIFSGFDFARMSTKKDERETYGEIKKDIEDLRKEAKKILKDISEKYFEVPLGDSLDEMKKLIPFTRTLISILEKYECIFREKKQKKGLMDFSDANHYALDILKNEQAAKELSERFNYIFIDEYQDSNYIQEEIISRISRGDNVFMVGDIKQSIYGFRMAEPDIFKKKYEDFSSDDPSGTKIDLNTNFRSKREVIDSVNDFFSKIMEGYDENAMLYKGDPYDGEISHDTELHIIDIEDKVMDEELKMLRNIEFEAMMCAEIIKENLGKSIYDSKLGYERPMKKSDIVILLRNAKNRAGLIYDVLMDNGIEAFLEDNNGFFDAVEIMTIVDLLKVIDNRHNDIALISVLRSGIFGFSADDLVKIRLSSPKGDFYGAMTAYDDDPVLAEKIAGTIAAFESWWERSMFMTIGEMVSAVLTESGYYAYAGALPGGKQRQANLRSFSDKALQYDNRGDGTIFGFLRYIETIRNESDNPLAPMIGEGEDAVRIMTIHKSKGLEFPMVIVCQTGDSLKMPKARKEGIWHKDLGYALQYINTAEHYSHNSILANIISGRKARESIQEEIRIFYVACTRAKEKLVLIGSRGKRAADSYLAMIEPVIDRRLTKVMEYNAMYFKDLQCKSEADQTGGFDFYSNSDSDESTIRRINDLLEYEYPNKRDLAVKSKYSVSELNAQAKADSDTKASSKADYSLDIPKFAQGEKVITGAAFGTLMHAVMEYIDFDVMFDKIDEGSQNIYLEEIISDMIQESIIDEAEADAVDRDKIIKFFESELGTRIRSAGNVFKEKQFNILHEKDGNEIVVQGIIDCYFEEKTQDGEHQLILVDYKTNLSTEGIEDLYRGQMELYSEALEKSTGLRVAEKYLYLFTEDRALKIQ